MTLRQLYDSDFYAWINEQTAPPRAGKTDEIDLANLAEEIECLGKRERREFVCRLRILMRRLLKWENLPDGRGGSLKSSIRIARNKLADRLDDSPSLKLQAPSLIEWAYEDAVIQAASQIGLPEDCLPPTCPCSFEQMLDQGFWPDKTAPSSEPVPK